MLTIISNLMKTILLLILTGITVLIVWKALVPPAPSIPQARIKLAENAAERFVEQLRQNRGGAKSVVVLHLANDPTHCVTRTIRNRIRETGILNLANDSLMERFMSAFNLPFNCCDNVEDAMAIAEKAPQDMLVWGTVNRFETDENGHPVIIGELHVIDAIAMEPIFTFTMGDSTVLFETQQTKTVMPQTLHANILSRLAIFLLLAILVPLLSFSSIRKLVAKRSNNVNLALLATLSAIDTTLAVALFGAVANFLPFSWFLLATMTASIFCNHMLLSHAARLEA